MPNTDLLPLLASGDFVSGQEIADVLGVSRTAVWKQLNKLSELGLEVESVKGRGYRIEGGIDLLDGAAVQAGMSAAAQALLTELDIHQGIGSTNAEAMSRVAAGAGSGYVCTAEQQTAGRGRRGRAWVSPYARNLYVSAVWEYQGGAAALEGMSLAVGVAVARALAACGVPPVQLKWPNDVLHEGAKLGGILLEMTGDAAGVCQVVVGIGLNVDMPAQQGGDIDQAWTDVRHVNGGDPVSRSQLLGVLLSELLPLLAGFEATGFAPWREAWQGLDAYADTEVVLSSGEQQMAGVARGVDDRGALQLETATAGIKPVFGGEISLRPQA
ncbi:bifunctional biotin--[acetyl-CoA-carboxylase] synthetase/biotin operon repressor [Halioglobus sp. HI00S01]|uniref:bifunctional biotin--[acetyl-CoA-carboxylase] ligase/biotin operon repressor BirA n=1 Tax=Halioglobus sp. HI00S01 TaxID=1822214 RepID=UPI0007C31276|nr:bifunctional biotin--[acetyl-CoA-carboxylase] ligase/biotin operon repressor BirA [Halioglobus sp. HI00S01]KZX51347.1 bifunctional biotin--[acetyl-CoA-carboxylase] synthetase/biotin operon repressor [Halioglobus sp. HI00S01]